MKRISIHTDGAARGNPGPASVAYVINLGDDVIEEAEPIGSTTNNQAEYRAMRQACEKLLELSPEQADLQFFSDSELMVKQLNGEYRVKDAKIQPHYAAIQSSLAQLRARGNRTNIAAVRLALNKRADELANLALDGKL